ncbi:MAG TPA: NAD(P)/FAD-dependent oxidoreductase [Candidatus Pacearchaeota archaeon]|nr:NAD(P)/FAD-dependent oxidoreductase [Candidatus Pacearchaeota archaeon]HQM24400.1 NAD(P)/FAD-dependent oxidoreductase [Candidatus Pacearchaeota archaeon]
MEDKNKFDVAIIGGGPAGMMAAIFAAKKDKKVILIEKNNTLGKKLLLTGDGRCNITNENLSKKEVIKNLGKNWDFLLSGLSLFGVNGTKDFFESNGLKLTTKENGKMFPFSEKSKDVLNLLIKELNKYNVKILLNAQVSEVEFKGKSISKIILKNKKEIIASNYILTTGGKSYPTTGSTGDGFVWIKSIGHEIKELRPGLSPFQIKENWVKELSGLSLSNIGLKVISGNKTIKKWKGDILFAHFGITGPLILDQSREISKLMEKNKIVLSIDLFPEKSLEFFSEDIAQLIEKNRNRNVEKIVSLIIPNRLAQQVISFSKIDCNKKGNNISKKERVKLASILKNITLHPTGTLGFDRAMITSGGISLKEIDSKTMKSKLTNNLFFAGEIIDLDGPCGGYNLQICWTTGYLAGTNA